MLLQAVDVSRYLVVHRSGGLRQNLESSHTSQATDPHFRLGLEALQDSRYNNVNIAAGAASQQQRKNFFPTCFQPIAYTLDR